MSLESHNERILVVSEIVGDADLVRRLLADEFGEVRASIDRQRRQEDFDQFAPAVLVLAFNSLDKAERYLAELSATSAIARRGRHRTLVLCTREEVRKAYDLCKRGMFDDYVLFWPLTHDTPRLFLAVQHALRQWAVRNDEGQADSPAPKQHEIPPAPARPVVLVVDDDPFQHRLLTQMLAAQPVDLCFAASAQQGLEMMHKHQPSAVLMDINMPEIDGVEATRRIKAERQFQDVPVVMVTGLGTRDRVVESRQAGASEFLVKPVNRDALLQKLRKLGVLPA